MHLLLAPDHARKRRLGPAVLIALLAVATAGAAHAATPTSLMENGGPRVRPNDMRLATLLRLGANRSPTIRTMLDRIEKSDVIVYLEMQPRLRKHLSGCLTWVTVAGRFRFVRASFNPELAIDQQIAAIGHELQHVLEIIDAPQVVNETSLMGLYSRIGRARFSGRLYWDTEAAQEAGQTVHRELTQLSEASAQGAITPLEWHAYYADMRTRESDRSSQSDQNRARAQRRPRNPGTGTPADARTRQ